MVKWFKLIRTAFDHLLFKICVIEKCYCNIFIVDRSKLNILGLLVAWTISFRRNVFESIALQSCPGDCVACYDEQSHVVLVTLGQGQFPEVGQVNADMSLSVWSSSLTACLLLHQPHPSPFISPASIMAHLNGSSLPVFLSSHPNSSQFLTPKPCSIHLSLVMHCIWLFLSLFLSLFTHLSPFPIHLSRAVCLKGLW